jgi:hypothetical protein
LPSTPVVSNVADSVSCKVVYITTSIANGATSDHISVYPNPFSDHITLSFSKPSSCKIELVDLLGKVLYSSNVKDKKEQAVIQTGNLNLSAGMYYIRLTGDVNQQIKVVKTK